MRYGTPSLTGALTGSFDHWYVVDVFYDGVRVLRDVDVTNVTVDDDATALVQGSASLTIVYQGAFAETVAPTAIGDYLSPFGTKIILYALVNVGPGFAERVTLGHYEIAETPHINSTQFVFNTAILSKGDLIDLTLKDAFDAVQADRFDVPGSPPNLSSVWTEIQRLTGLPVTRTITDAPISSSVAYQEDKLHAIYDLAGSLDAVAYMTPDGTVSMRPNVWPSPVDVLKGGDEGTLVGVTRGMSNSSVYNRVVVRSYAGTTESVLASGEITDGPLRAQNVDGSLSPFRRRPMFFSSQYVNTPEAAMSFVNNWLPRVSKLRSVEVVLSEIFNPLRELGDVLDVRRMVQGVVVDNFYARVTRMRRTQDTLQDTTVVVQP
ncbi:hypothetical protein KPL76_06155 [Subtercola sp. PAMC28395]|uniref:hypothetical protein n=1 Tax=Subtercola sp. PAMC28395 TaxID=2846775 RepID=UPI001C0C18BF|nr:hypothetical protein [Subtercola sp. PAMC28395]QWT24936.1 hypothetical protein KPL76_06155 [Subtercola sp. PAMC28395]